MIGLGLIPVFALTTLLSTTPLFSVDPQETVSPQVAEVIDLGEIVVLARRPGTDPSQAMTECIWLQLPAEQRLTLSGQARTAVATLANHDEVPLSTPHLRDDVVSIALTACGGAEEPSLLRFVRTALAAYAVELETADALRRDRVTRARMLAAWERLSAERREVLLVATVTPDAVTADDEKVLIRAIWELLRHVRPLGAINPFGYQNGSANHRVLYFIEAHAIRRAMERLF